MGRKENQYKGENVESAIATGLLDLGKTEEEVEIEVVSEGGLLKKAVVKISFEEEFDAEELTEDVATDEEIEAEESLGEIEVSEEVKVVGEKAFAFVKGLIELMGVDCEVTPSFSEDGVIINVDGPEARIIIGKRGEVLDSIQYLSLIIGNKGEGEFVRVSLDSENYRDKRKGILERVAENNARKALKFGEIIELEPMNPYERRVIHTALAEERGVITRSEGEGRERHVIIIPLNESGEEVTKRYRERSRRQQEYGTSNEFRKFGAGKMRSFGQSKRRF